MMIEQHYDEEVLAEFLAEPGETVSRDKHLAGCSLCLRTLDSLRTSATVLAKPSVWDTTPISPAPRPDTLAFLRNVQKTMLDENAMAAVWIKQLLAGPREAWAPRMAEHPEWRTAGMVRKLIAASEDAVSKVPEEALAMSALAVQIVEPNLAAANVASTMRHLAGLAYYQRAYALWYTGSIMEAMKDYDLADRILSTCVGTEVDRARVSLMRAMTFQMLERRDEAIALAQNAAEVFEQYRDRDRVAAARSVIAITLQEAQRHREALPIHAEVAAMEGISESWRLSAVHNMAICHRAVSEFEQATKCLLEAIAGYDRIGMMTFRSKSRWVLADIFAQQSKHEEALKLYLELRTEFEELGMANDVAMLSLDAADMLVALDRTAEIAGSCRAAIEYFVANGLAQTEPALRGLSYLHEAAAAGRAMPSAIRGVRAFLLAPTSEAALLFAEPLQ